jgi:translation initiation factor 1
VAKRSAKARVPVLRSDEDLRRARPEPAASSGPPGRVEVRREVAGRKGKGVTTVRGVPEAEARDLAAKLKRRCGVGGSAKDGVIELQGDHRDVVVEVLEAEGYRPVRAGG